MLALWQALSLAYPPLVVPPIPAVGKILARILSAPDLLHEAVKTLGRLAAGLFFGVAAGCLVGYVCGVCKTCRELCKPVLGVLQVVPPVALLVLAIIWFGFNGKPAVLIVAVAIFPIIAISVQDAVLHVDRKLLEMGTVFKYTKKRRFFFNHVAVRKAAVLFRFADRLGYRIQNGRYGRSADDFFRHRRANCERAFEHRAGSDYRVDGRVGVHVLCAGSRRRLAVCAEGTKICSA